MNGHAGEWRRSRAAQFADPRHREQTINAMRRDASRVVSIGRESESLWESYQPTVSTATGGWSNTGRRRAEKMMPKEKKGFEVVSRQGVWTPAECPPANQRFVRPERKALNRNHCETVG